MTGIVALVRAAHIEPTIVVTTIAALLAAAAGLSAPRQALVVAAVLAGQLVIGWSNDLIDAARDTAAHRDDKPLATGELTLHPVSIALAVAAVATVGLSAALGWRSAVVHLGLVVGSGLAYNLGLKATAWSWLPFTVAFGSLPAVVSLASPRPVLPAAWLAAAGAALGTAAHFLNTVPDIADDVATGIRGLPHRIGARRSQIAAVLLLLSSTVVAVIVPTEMPSEIAWATLLAAALLSSGALIGKGEVPFRCGVAIAIINVTLVVLMSLA